MTRNDTKIAVDLGAGIDGSGVAGNDHRSLTRSLDLGEEGLMAHSMPPSDEDGRHPRAIAAVPVTYDGVRYRSALEADWAATLKHLGIYFEYEPQPWRLPSGAVYDCDFYLPNDRIYCEAKGPHNERLWKPREFAAALERDEFPMAYLVVVLRPAGPNGGCAWETASSVPNLRIVKCAECYCWTFAVYDDTWGLWFCRRCGSSEFSHEHRSETDVEGYALTFRHAPRPGAAA